ncbi:MAG: lipopolysaccharide kinase InaA family protein [Planctomycetota bacterium]
MNDGSTIPAQFSSTFEHIERDDICLWYDPTLVPADSLPSLIRLPGQLQDIPGTESRASGRRTVWRWSPSWAESALIVRQYAHGGLLAPLFGTAFLSDKQMRGELRIAHHARQRGLSTSRPVALRISRGPGPLRRGYYLTREIPSALNLLEYCNKHGPQIAPPSRFALAKDIGRTIARMHEIGVYHDDLNLKNVLVKTRESPPESAIVDFKKARLQQHVPMKDGLPNLRRLDRSILKWPASRNTITLSDRLRVLRTYIEERTATGTDWKNMARQTRTDHWLHRWTRRT